MLFSTSQCSLFVITGELPSLLILDDLSRHACAYREIYLLFEKTCWKRSLSRRNILCAFSTLRKVCKVIYNLGGGSLTCFPVIETLAGDVSGYISTNVISITDGQIAFICRLISIRYSSSYRCWIICNTCGFYSSMVWNEICGRFL